MDNKKSARQWQRIATMNLDSAEYLQGMRPTPIEIICYHCQQSAEKHLKGYLVLNGTEPPKTHDLRVLAQMCADINPAFEAIKIDCAKLTIYSVQPRYPVGLGLEEQDMRRALTGAKEIQNFVLAQAPEMSYAEAHESPTQDGPTL